MPVENLEEDGLEKNPKLILAQWKFLLASPDFIQKKEVAIRLMDSIREDRGCPQCISEDVRENCIPRPPSGHCFPPHSHRVFLFGPRLNHEEHRESAKNGGDWDRRNRLKVYQGTHCLLLRHFRAAAALFLDTTSTFTSYELMDYNGFVRYTVYICMLTLPRNELRDKKVLRYIRGTYVFSFGVILAASLEVEWPEMRSNKENPQANGLQSFIH
ncbi:Putative accessory gland protein [Gryllus bimaculatus]|nr:Putative accessory gland protein [Gryllus bimaculatus]